MNTLELLTEGRDRIEQGWTQNSFRTTRFPRIPLIRQASYNYCSLGAIAYAKGTYDPGREYAHAELLLWQAICERPNGRRYHSVANFNDAASTTKVDVLSVFDRAIELAAALQKAQEELEQRYEESRNEFQNRVALTTLKLLKPERELTLVK